MKTYRILAVLFCVLTVSVAAAPNETKQINIGAVLHLTGDLAPQSVAFREGIEIALENYPERKNIKLIIEDGRNEAKTSHTAVTKLVSVDKVSAVILSSYLDAMPNGAELERRKIPSIVLWDSNPEIESLGEYMFAIGPWTASSGEVAAEFAVKTLKAKRAAVFTNQDSWSEGVSEYFKKKFKELGGEVDDQFIINASEVDFKTLLAKAKAMPIDIIYTPLVNNIPAFYKQAKQIGFGKTIVSSDIIAEEHTRQAPETFEGVYQTNIRNPNSDEYKHLEDLYRKKFGKDINLPWFVAVGFDGMNLLLKANEEVGSDGTKIKDYLYSLKNYRGASSQLSFNSKGSAPQFEAMYQFRNGKFVAVE